MLPDTLHIIPTTRQTPTVCLVGLGNPGEEYAATRHNIGFRVLERLADRLGVQSSSFRIDHYHAETVRETARGASRILFCKPWTYMNLSGDAVLRIMESDGLAPGQLLVICDDIALPLGTVRLRRRGGSGGQRGLESIIARLGTDAFPRLRCGIGPVPQEADVIDFVLGRFLPEEHRAAEALVERACDAVLCMIEEGIDRAMTAYNVTELKEEPPVT